MKKRRNLSKEERSLWESVAKTMTAIEKVEKVDPQDFLSKPKTAARRPQKFESFSVGETAKETLPRVGSHLPTTPLNMDAKSFGRMKRGKLSPEGRIDLHGMTVAEAHRELTEFILDASAAGKRLVLVITGKGLVRDDYSPIPIQRGVLRTQVPQWLTLAPLRSHVLQVTPAHVRHGGEGALYIYLRRRR